MTNNFLRYKSLPFRVLLGLLTLSFFSLQSSDAQSAAISIDGVFNDWISSLAIAQDPKESVSGIDILNLSVTNDREYIFIRIEADSEFDFSDDIVDHNIQLFIDTDNDVSTGSNRFSGLGADLIMDFSNRRVSFYNPNVTSISLNDISIRVAPTVTSKSFEFAIPRDVLPDGRNRLFTSSSVRFILANLDNNDRVPNNGSLVYNFDETRIQGYEVVDIQKQNTELVRIVAYNTLYNGLTVQARIPHYEKILKALNPDIIGYSECWDVEASQVKVLMDEWLPLNTNDGWYVEKQSDRGLITASRWEILNRWTNVPKQFPVLINLPEEYASDLLFTNAHLNCCGNESGRQDQADAYSSFITDAKTEGGDIDLPKNTPFVYAGDLNLVGFSQQLNTLISGDIQNTSTYGPPSMPDWDGTEVTDLISLHTDERFSFTWKDESSSFPPGKLDFMIYSDAVLSVDKSFILRTEEMSTARLALYDLDKNNTESASDHFPVTADFIVTKTVNSLENQLKSDIQISPNPASDQLKITFSSNGTRFVELMDNQGRVFKSSKYTGQELVLNTNELSPGIYFIRIQDKSNQVQMQKVIKH